jgi:flagellar assembly protein FliH
MQREPLILNNIAIAEEFEDVKVDSVNTLAAEQMINSAKEEAAAILAQAKILADQSSDEACQQVERIKQQAYDEGYQKGQEEGRAQGKQSGLDEMQVLINEAAEKAQGIVAASEKEAKEMILAAEGKIVEIALAVASRILACRIEEDPMTVLPIVKKALEKVRDQEQIVLRVSADDFEVVVQAKKEFQHIVGRDEAVTISVDRTIERGSCVIDTSCGLVDAKIDTQFAALKKALEGVRS